MSDDTADISKLLRDIPLSESRLRHIFRNHTGISIRRFILWTRIKIAFQAILRGETLSQAAYLSGFSDYAHMSRVVKEMFGINPKTILKNSHIIQDIHNATV